MEFYVNVNNIEMNMVIVKIKNIKKGKEIQINIRKLIKLCIFSEHFIYYYGNDSAIHRLVMTLMTSISNFYQVIDT